MNVKLIGGAAGSGFALSFLTGIFSKNSFGSIILKSFIFALIFAVLAVLISFLFDKFLADSSGPSASTGASFNQNKTGGNVDIVISDDNLDDDDSGPKFYVENNRQTLAGERTEEKQEQTSPVKPEPAVTQTEQMEDKPVTPEKVHDYSSAEPSESSEAAFVSAPLQAVAGAEKEETSAPSIARDVPANAGDGANKVNSYADGTNIDNIDALPDIGEWNESGKNESVNDIINDSDFATKGSSASGGSTFPNGTEASAANADVMAQAIRTLLKKDD